ncbi:MAG: four helix bundle protein [Patescibacteria group bacterium]|nr:four helix bundle protein [Patescibacteria group bacterium]
MGKKYIEVKDLEVYKAALELSQYVWEIVLKWNYFAKKTIGTQFVSAIDSISSNIAEGWGRYHKKEKIRFFYFSRGSLDESKDWTRKA